MRITLITISISLCLAVTVFARPEEPKLEEINSNAQPGLEDLQEEFEDQPDDISRKKKSTVTTFCVEIRPADHKPFQVCEPVAEKGGYNNAAVPAPFEQSSGGFEHLKPVESFNSASEIENKPAAAYSPPVKTYSDSDANDVNTAAKPAPAYNDPYRSTKPEHEEDAEKQSPARASKLDNADKTVSLKDKAANEAVQQTAKQDPAARTAKESDEEDDEMSPMRAVHHQDPYNYGPGHDTPTSLIPVSPARHSHHSGLVITCQPNLAGYAHGIPGAYHDKLHHGGAVPAYNYRSAGGGYERPYQSYRPQPQPYGGYKQYAARPIYKPQVQAYKPVYSHPYSHSVPVYKPPIHTYPSHAYKPPVASMSAEAYYPPAPEYRPAYTPPVDYKPPAYSSAYITPGTYRAADEENGDKNTLPAADKVDKEGYTLHKMEEISEKRADGTRWAGEIEVSRDEAREADQGGWRNDAETVANAEGEWRDGALGNWRDAAGGKWRDADGAKSAGNWRNIEEALEWRDAASEQENEEFGARSADSSQANAEGIVSSENKIEDNE